MELNSRRILADLIIIIITALLTPIYVTVYVLRVILRVLDKREPIKSKRVLITGATSGLGKSLAEQYVKTSETLLLVGRNKEKLENVKRDCEKINGDCVVKTVVADMNKPEEYRKILESCAQNESVDLIISNAGVIESTATCGSNIVDYANEAVDVNMKGVLNTILPFIPKMKEVGSGQVCVIVGALGNGTFGRDPIYEGTKNGIRVTLEGLMAPLESVGIHLTIVSPGFMKTKMTEGKKTIMALEPSFVAERIYEGVSRRDQFICDPYPIYAFTGVMKALPATVFVTINELLMKTKEKRDLFVCLGSIIIWITA